MTAIENRKGELRRLLMELGSDLAAMKELAAFAAEIFDLAGPAEQPGRRDQMALALTIHHIYTALEQALPLRMVIAVNPSGTSVAIVKNYRCVPCEKHP